VQRPAGLFCAHEDHCLAQLLAVGEDHLTQHRQLLSWAGAAAAIEAAAGTGLRPAGGVAAEEKVAAGTG
jgi:hypothetical protein